MSYSNQNLKPERCWDDFEFALWTEVNQWDMLMDNIDNLIDYITSLGGGDKN